MGNSRIQFRRGKAAFWTDENPVLHPAEPGYETDTGKYKIGDGLTHWNELDYVSNSGAPNDGPALDAINAHLEDPTPHSVYDDGPSLVLLYENVKV